jgi:hypothetical protein
MPVAVAAESAPADIQERAKPAPGESVFFAYMDRSSRERAEQTASFERALTATREDFKDAIGSLRGDFRTFGVIMLAGILALAGVNVAINSGALNFTSSPVKQGAAP